MEMYLKRVIKRLEKLQDDTTGVAPYAALIDVGYFLSSDLATAIDELKTVLNQMKNDPGCTRSH
ncbi:hypothetical protein D3C73_388070 [compost metagenome]